MGIQCQEHQAVLEGHVTVEEAETLLSHLRLMPAPAVDLAGCDHLHAAALQVLLALRPRIATPPADPWLAAVLLQDEKGQPCRP